MEAPIRHPESDYDDSSSGSSRKRIRPSTSWVSEAEGSTPRSHQTPAPRAQQMGKRYIYDSMMPSKEARITTTQRLYPHPMLGHSAPQEMMISQVQELLEGPSDTQHKWHSMVPQQVGLQPGGSLAGLYKIPGSLTLRQQLMLQITEDEARLGAVHSIKCKLCPKVALRSWQCYQRHCDESEAHPVELNFCDRCGDHFARADSLKRHARGKNCHRRTQDNNEGVKKRINWHLNDFNARMERSLRTGEVFQYRFAEIAHRIRNESNGLSTSGKAPEKK